MTEQELKEYYLKRGDLLIKTVGVVLSVVTIVIGAVQYTYSISHQKEMEFKRAMWTKQMTVYTQACKHAGLTAMHRGDSSLFTNNFNEFGGLYWGEMIMVEDSVVEKAMKDFYYAVLDSHPQDKRSINKIKYKADQLAKACRASSHRYWKQVE